MLRHDNRYGWWTGILVGWLILVWVVPGRADFNDLQVGPRATGMGGAFLAVANDPYAVFYNPAGLAQLYGTHIPLMYGNLLPGLTNGQIFTSYLGLTLPLRERMRWGLGWYRRGTGDGLNTLLNEDLLIFSLARPLWGPSLVGLNLKYMHLGWNPQHPDLAGNPYFNDRFSKGAVAVDVGLLLPLTTQYTLGLMVSNLWSGNLGLQISERPEGRFRLGLAWRPELAPYTTFTADWLVKRLGTADLAPADQGRIRFGVEQRVHTQEALVVRSGIALGQGKELAFGGSYGIQRAPYGIQFDYSFTYPLSALQGTFGNHHFALTFTRDAEGPDRIPPEVWLSTNHQRLLLETEKGQPDSLVFTLRATDDRGTLARWHLAIGEADSAGNRIIWTAGGEGNPPARLSWQAQDNTGQPVEEGRYWAVLTGTDRADNSAASPPLSLTVALPPDRTPPYTRITTSTKSFYPRGDSAPTAAQLILEARDERGPLAHWQLEASNREAAGRQVVYLDGGRGSPPDTLLWTGCDSSGAVLADGYYYLTLSAFDQAGNQGRSLPLIIEIASRDTVPPTVALNLVQDQFAVNEEGTNPSFPLLPLASDRSSGLAGWTLQVAHIGADQKAIPIRSFKGNGQTLMPILWDGRDEQGQLVASGTYRARLEVWDRMDNRASAEAGPFTVTRTRRHDSETTLSVAGQKAIDKLPQGVSETTQADPANAITPTLVLQGVNTVIRLSEGDILLSVPLFFETGKAEIKATSQPTLLMIGAILSRYPDHLLMIEGHTDNVGDADYNRRLSEQRAQAVADFLNQSVGIPRAHMTVQGWGETRPVASNDTPQGREQNRRVEIIVAEQLGPRKASLR